MSPLLSKILSFLDSIPNYFGGEIPEPWHFIRRQAFHFLGGGLVALPGAILSPVLLILSWLLMAGVITLKERSEGPHQTMRKTLIDHAMWHLGFLISGWAITLWLFDI